MKKISAVLLVLVLVGSVAFAGFTGSAETTFGVDLGNGDYGFVNDKAFDIELLLNESIGESSGEGDVFAEIKATFTFTYADAVELDDPFADPLHWTALEAELEFDYARIVGEDWSVGILGAMAAPNFASSAIDIDNSADEEALDLDPADVVEKGAGIEVGYAGYNFGLSIPYGTATTMQNNYETGKYYLFGSVETPEFELGDGLTLAFGASGLLADNNKAASGSVKGAYSMDDITATISADVIYDGGLEAEVAVNTVIDIVTLDVYFATLDDSIAGEEAYDDGIANILSAKAAFSIDQFDITVTGKDILNASILSASVDFAATEEIAVNVNGGYTLMGVNEQDWHAGAGVTYTAEKYVASADATYSSDETIEVNASVESDVLVPGATLSLGYGSADVMTNAGKITAAVNIAF